MCFSLIQLNDLAVLDLNCESSLHCPLTYSLMFMQCSLKASESLGMVHFQEGEDGGNSPLQLILSGSKGRICFKG